MSRPEEKYLGAAWVLWCQERADELPLSMERVHHEAGTTLITFRGAHPNLRCVADETGLRTRLHWSGEWRGDLREFDLAPKRDPQGRWYCGLCCVDQREYFPSLHALWRAHIFPEWLEHVQALFAQDTWVLYRDMGDSATCDAGPARLLFGKWGRHRGDYTLLFRACADPQALTPNFVRPIDMKDRLVGGFMKLGSSVTGIGRKGD